MFRHLIILLSVTLWLSTTPALAQKKGEVKQIRRVSAQDVNSVKGEPVRTADQIRPMVEEGPRGLLTRLGEAFLAEDAEAVSECMAEQEIPFSLDPRDGNADPAKAPLQSREQIYYRLREYFEQVEVEKLECDCPEENLGVEDAHGVLELGLKDSPRSRLYLRLRRADETWRVVEMRALP